MGYIITPDGSFYVNENDFNVDYKRHLIELKNQGAGNNAGTLDHTKLINKNNPNQHSISAITNLQNELDGKQPKGNYVTPDQIPSLIVSVKDIPASSFEIEHNTIYRKNEPVKEISLTVPTNPQADFICEMNFTSDASWVGFTAPDTLKWIGDGVKDGAFVPNMGKRYTILFYFDGMYMRAVAQEA